MPVTITVKLSDLDLSTDTCVEFLCLTSNHKNQDFVEINMDNEPVYPRCTVAVAKAIRKEVPEITGVVLVDRVNT